MVYTLSMKLWIKVYQVLAFFGVLAFWVVFFTKAERASFGNNETIVIFTLITVLNAVVLISGPVRKGPLLSILITELMFTIVLLISLFSALYWGYGTTTNFSPSLSRLDAIYFTIGTLSTAGTGNIVAISESARFLQTAQMAIDVFLVVFAIALIMPRFISRDHT
jgi:hypothetical protein